MNTHFIKTEIANAEVLDELCALLPVLVARISELRSKGDSIAVYCEANGITRDELLDCYIQYSELGDVNELTDAKEFVQVLEEHSTDAYEWLDIKRSFDKICKICEGG